MGAKRGKHKKNHPQQHRAKGAPDTRLYEREEIPKELNTEQANPTETKNAEEKEMPPKNSFWEWVKRDTTLTNLIVAVFTVVIALVGFLQWSAIDGQLKAMIEAERPWLGEIAVSSDPIASGKPGVAKLSVANTGRSPARIISFRAGQQIWPIFPKSPPYQTNGTPWPNDLSASIVLPGMTATNEFKFNEIDPAIFQLLLDVKVRLYIYGTVEYEDLRVRGSKHTTTICLFWTAKNQTVPFVNCPEYNEAN